MPANPFIRLFEMPVETLTSTAYALVLLAALVATWWAAGRNLLWLDRHWGSGWKYLPPFWPALRMIAVLIIAAVDLLLIAGIIGVLA